MKKVHRLLTLFLIVLISISCNQETTDADLIIKNTNIIDPVGRRILANQTVLIKDGLIKEIIDGEDLQFNIPDSILINGENKYIISGFWNMHTHVCWKDDLDKTLFPIMLSYGITGIRDMGGDVDIMNEFKERVRLNPQAGPVIFGAGPIIDGEHPIHPDFSVAITDENLIETLDDLRQKQVDFLKVYSLLPEKHLEQISAYATKHDMTFAGHVSEYTSPISALEMGQRSLEHLNRIEEFHPDSNELTQFIERAQKSSTWLCPSLIIYQRKVDLAEGVDLYHPLYEQVDELLKPEWQQAKNKREGVVSNPDKLQDIQSKFIDQKNLVKLFYDQGLSMLIGSDFAGMPYVYPGFSFHEEMALMAEIGVENYDILRMATYEPALFFEITNSHGSIELGKVADLIILDKNPVEDIRNTLEISTVIRDGKQLDVSLEGLLLNKQN